MSKAKESRSSRSALGPFSGAITYIQDVLSDSTHIHELLVVADAGEAREKIYFGYVRTEGESDQTAQRPYILLAIPDDFQIDFLAHATYRSTCSVFIYMTDIIRGTHEVAYLNFLDFCGTVAQVIVNGASVSHNRWMFNEVEAMEIVTPFRRTDPEIDGEDNSGEGNQAALESYWEGAFNILLR